MPKRMSSKKNVYTKNKATGTKKRMSSKRVKGSKKRVTSKRSKNRKGSKKNKKRKPKSSKRMSKKKNKKGMSKKRKSKKHKSKRSKKRKSSKIQDKYLKHKWSRYQPNAEEKEEQDDHCFLKGRKKYPICPKHTDKPVCMAIANAHTKSKRAGDASVMQEAEKFFKLFHCSTKQRMKTDRKILKKSRKSSRKGR